MAISIGHRVALALVLGTAVVACGASADPTPGEDSTAARDAGPSLPLRTAGRWILDARGQRVTLAAVSWRGAEGRDYVPLGLDRRSVRDIVAGLKKSGFNAVRLAWSNELLLLGSLTTVDPARVARNPELKGQTGMEVFDAVVKAITASGLMVILDNRNSDAGASSDEGNARWYTADYPEEKWIADWKAMARRYARSPLVVGADLRCELRRAKDGPTEWDAWAAAAERAGDAVLEANPNLLVVVEGVDHAADLRGVRARPVRLSQPGHLVYEVHARPPETAGHDGGDRAARVDELGARWGYLLAEGQPGAAPVWVGELGTRRAGDDDGWSDLLRAYVAETGVGWSYAGIEGM